MSDFHFSIIFGEMFAVVGFVLYTVCRTVAPPAPTRYFFDGVFAGVVVSGLSLMAIAYFVLPQ